MVEIEGYRKTHSHTPPDEQYRKTHSGERRIPVDSFYGPSQIFLMFHGCWWHGHNSHSTKGKDMNEVRKRPMTELLKETKAIS